MKTTSTIAILSALFVIQSFGDEPNNFWRGFGEVVAKTAAEELLKSKPAKSSPADDARMERIRRGTKEVQDTLAGKWEATGPNDSKVSFAFKFEPDPERPHTRQRGFVTVARDLKPILESQRCQVTMDIGQAEGTPISTFDKTDWVFVLVYVGDTSKSERWRIMSLAKDTLELLVPGGDGDAVRLSLKRTEKPVTPSLLFPGAAPSAK